MTVGETLENHFTWRPGWRPGRDYLTWHVLPDDSLVDATAAARSALGEVPGLAAVPRDRLHVTGPGVGFADETSPATTEAIVRAARTRLRAVAPLRVPAEGVVVGRAAVALLLEPAGLADLRHVLRAAVREAGVEPPGADDEAFRPHLTLAYATGPASRAHVDSALGAVDLSDLPALRVTQASLLALRMAPPGYDWDVVGQARLGG